MMIPLIASMPTMGACTAEGCPDGWITPGDTRAEQDNVNEAVQSLDADMTASASVGLLTAWRQFRASWDSFYADQGGVTGWLGRFLSASNYEKTLDYRKQLQSWRAKFMGEGGQPNGPGLVEKPAPKPGGLSDLAKYAMITAVALGAVYVVSETGLLRKLVPRTNPRRRRRR
jgi:hypothetical protein